jgi:hypothetical protein
MTYHIHSLMTLVFRDLSLLNILFLDQTILDQTLNK